MPADDVIIVGGGLVGALLAAALGQEGFRVALVEARPAPAPPPADSIDLRVSALTRATENALRATGVWDRLPAARVTPFREMRVWDATGAGSIHFDSADIGEPCLGFIVENRRLQAALEARIAGLDGVAWHRPVVPDRIRVEPGLVTLSARDEEFTAPLLVGADGSHSRVREMAGIRVGSQDYRHAAVVATVEIARGHQETAWQRFLPTGPLALLPLPASRGAIVWSTTPDHARELTAASPEAFSDALEAAFERRFGRMVDAGARRSFPLRGAHARDYVKPRVALVGDAAHTVHPLAGQGVNLGFLDVGALVAVLVRARARGQDLGSYAVLRRYERWRKGHNLAMQKSLEGLKWLFGASLPPVRVSRNVGLSLTNRIGPVRRLIMRHAAGLRGDLPPLARGSGHAP